MNAKELRIGNYILGLYQNEDDDLIHETICEFKFHNCYDNFYHVESKNNIEEYIGFKPIELTEEWLQKFGFELYDSVEFRHFYRKNDFDLDENYQPIDFDCIEIKYVHQLQNLYFALTGQELEIK